MSSNSLAQQPLPQHDLESYFSRYTNTALHNEMIFREFTQLVDSVPSLKEHKNYVDKNQLGFGDRAFHYMWYLILIELKKKFTQLELLEIGVYKGQMLSLWGLLGTELGINLVVNGVSPLKGNLAQGMVPKVLRRLRVLFDRNYRLEYVAQKKVGNQYLDADYRRIVTDLFVHYHANVQDLQLFEGFSNDPKVFNAVSKKRFHVIYIDGDHSFRAALSDIENYAPLVIDGGYLVMDDAAFRLPGTGYFKGYESVARACDCLPQLGFVNTLNVGHNRIFQRQRS